MHGHCFFLHCNLNTPELLWSRIRSWFVSLYEVIHEKLTEQNICEPHELLLLWIIQCKLFICLFIWKWAWPADLHLICASDDELHRLSGCVMTKYKEFSYIGELSGVHLFVQCSLSAHAHFPSPPIDQQPHLKLREAESVFLSGGCRGWTVIADSSGTPNGSSASCYCLCLCVMVFFMCCIQCPDGAHLVSDSFHQKTRCSNGFHKPIQTICHTQVLLFCSLTCLISH